MLKFALRVIRIAPWMAALVASVAIGASTPAPEPTNATVANDAARPRRPVSAPTWSRQFDASRHASDPVGFPLVERMEPLELVATAYPVGSLDTALTVPAPVATVRSEVQRGFELPRPDRWTSLVTTLALGAFFFLRRIV